MELLIFGAGGFGRELGWLAEDLIATGGDVQVRGFIDETCAGDVVNGIPVMTISEAARRYSEARVVVGLGTPQDRETVFGRLTQAGFAAAPPIIAPGVRRSARVDIGFGTVICAGSILTTNIRLGSHVQINLSCTIGHDAVIDDFVTLAPGVHVSGRVHIGRGAYIGTGANIINGTVARPLLIGEGAVVGAGACVTRDVAPNVTVVGVPARTKQ